VKFELDIAWAVKGGADPVALFERYPGRFPLWHVKDLDQEHKQILPVGEGTVDYKKYFQHTARSGLVYYFIEHDMPQDPFDSISKSLKYIRQMG
jgi:sugar phosphate isomerase/epimerase